MNNKLEILKKRIVYRAGYRGTKEMDILLSSFVNKNINSFDENQLVQLENLLNYFMETLKTTVYYHCYQITEKEKDLL